MPDTERVIDELARLREENARLRRLLELTPEQARPPAPAQTGMFLDRPGPVTASSSGPDKVRFFRTLFASRTDVYRSARGACRGPGPGRCRRRPAAAP